MFGNDLTRMMSWVGTPIDASLKESPSCHTSSNAFSMSIKIAAVFSLLFFMVLYGFCRLVLRYICLFTDTYDVRYSSMVLWSNNLKTHIYHSNTKVNVRSSLIQRSIILFVRIVVTTSALCHRGPCMLALTYTYPYVLLSTCFGSASIFNMLNYGNAMKRMMGFA